MTDEARRAAKSHRQIAIPMVLLFLIASSALADNTPPGASPQQVIGNTGVPATTPAADELHQAELRRVEAERIKLELEAKEIERRLDARWWEGQQLTQYLLAIVITAALLFGWTRGYLQPILRREGELNALAQQRNAAVNELLEAQNKKVLEDQAKIANERDWLKLEADDLRVERSQLVTERDRLRKEQRDLAKKQHALQAMVTGLKLAVDRAAEGKATFFSILNSNDPINELSRSYGWKVWSDNFFGELGYYLVIQHASVRSGKRIIVGRTFEIEKLRKRGTKSLHDFLEKVNARDGPVLVLDHSTLALLVENDASVGGIIYKPGGEEIEFYAPLSQWSERLGALFPNEPEEKGAPAFQGPPASA